MIQTPKPNWWLLALCCLFEALYSLTSFFTQDPDGYLTLRASIRRGAAMQMGLLALAAGICAIAASIWGSQKGRPRFLLLNGVACTALGLIFTFWTPRLAFSTIALLIVVMAISLGLYQLSIARTLRPRLLDEWLFGAATAISLGFAATFLGFVFHWIKLSPAAPAQTLFWLGSYVGCSAISLLLVSVRLHRANPPKGPSFAPLPQHSP